MPQSNIWENFSKFLILWRVAWKVLSKKKTNSTEENVFKSFDGWYLILLFNKQHLQTSDIVLFFLLVWTNTFQIKLLCENYSFTKVFTGNDSLSCEHVLLYADVAIHQVWCFFSKESEASFFQKVFTEGYTPKWGERLWRFKKAKYHLPGHRRSGTSEVWLSRKRIEKGKM